VALVNTSPPILEPTQPEHWVLGLSAAGCVQAACDSYGLPGTVRCFTDDHACSPLVGESLNESLSPMHSDAVIIWRANNVGDAVFEAMVCHQLVACTIPVWRVQVPAVDDHPFVAMHSPEQIARLYTARQVLSNDERQQLAQDFARMRDTCGPVRRLEQGRVIGVAEDYYDPLLLSASNQGWQLSGHVVGAAMGQCDSQNLPGDGIFWARLTHLIAIGCIDAQGSLESLKDCSVRLATVLK
jgi:hypothetical protein